MMLQHDQLKPEYRLTATSALRAQLDSALFREIRIGHASVERLPNGDLRILLHADLLFSGAGMYGLNGKGRELLDRLAPSLLQLGAENRVRVVCHSSRPASTLSRALFIDAWKLTGCCSAHVVSHFLRKRELESLHFRAEGHAYAEPIAAGDDERNRRLEIRIEYFGG